MKLKSKIYKICQLRNFTHHSHLICYFIFFLFLIYHINSQLLFSFSQTFSKYFCFIFVIHSKHARILNFKQKVRSCKTFPLNISKFYQIRTSIQLWPRQSPTIYGNIQPITQIIKTLVLYSGVLPHLSHPSID